MTTTTTTTDVGFVGNLTADPELRFSNAGKSWLKARLSVQPYVKGAEVQPEPVFYDLVCFGTLAENVAESCRKGSRVVVSGRLEDDTWTGKDGIERTSQKLIADAIGPDLRFTTATITRTMRTEPASQPSTVHSPARPQRQRSYSEAPY